MSSPSGRDDAPRTRPTTARGGRRDALIDIAVELFSSKPYDEIFISDIAERAGVAHGLLFYHFKDKRGLYLAALERVLDEVITVFRPMDTDTDTATALKRVIDAHIQQRQAQPQAMLAMIRASGQDADLEALRERGRAAAADFVLTLLGAEKPSPALRVIVRGALGLVDEMTVAWLTSNGDLSQAQMQDLAYSAVVAVLSTVRRFAPELVPVLDELTEGYARTSA
jgi:AcrR family transcriptional regulator